MRTVILVAGGLGGLWLLFQPFATRLTAYLLVLPFLTFLEIHAPFKDWTFVPTAILLLTAVAAIGLPPRRDRNYAPRAARGLTVIILVYGGLALVEAFNPDLPSVTLGLRGARLVIEPLLLFFIGAEVATRPQLTSRVFKVLIGTGAVVAAYGLKQGLFGFDHREVLYYLASFQDVTLHEQRIFSTMPGASVLGNYMGLIAFLAIGLLVNGSKRVVALLVLVGAAALDAMMTGQRGVIVGALAGAIVVTAMGLARRSSRRRAVRVAQGLTLLVGVLAGLMIITPVEARSTLLTKKESAFDAARLKLALLKEPDRDASVADRELRLRQLGDALLKVPLGAGSGLNLLIASNTTKSRNTTALGTSGYGGAGYTPPVPPIPGELYYYTLGSELGLAGLALFLALMLFGLAVAIGVGVRHPDPVKSTIGFCAAGFIALVLVDSFTVDSMTAPQVASYLWLLIGMLGRWSQEDRLPGPGRRVRVWRPGAEPAETADAAEPTIAREARDRMAVTA